MVAKCLQKWDAPPSIGKQLNPFRNPRLVQELQSLLPLFRFSTRSDRCTIPQYDWTALQSLQGINWMTFPIYPWRLALPQISGRQEEYVVDQSTLNKESWKLQMLMLPGVSLGVATSYIRPVLSSFLLAVYLYLAPTPKKEMLSNFTPFNLAARLQERQ